uniref:Uncharacterized protein n=1 Tax=Oryza punctata TaxID=4537 RepID=A0A0E0L150_ORYPU
MDDEGHLTVTEVEKNMINTLFAEPYQPVFTVSHGTSYSSSSQHPNEDTLHPTFTATTIKDVSTSMALHVKEPCSQENFYLANNFPSLQGIENIVDDNPRMSLLHNTVVSIRDAKNQSPTMSGMVHADALEIYSSLDHHTSANNIQIQHALQAARQPSQQSLHADVAETNSSFGHRFRQLAPQVTTQPSNMSLHGSNNRNLRIGSGGDS